MENPRLTFATPTVIVGDKSLVSLVAHELAHSWSGNLVTNSSCEGHLAQRRLHHLRREPHHRGAVRQGTRRHGERDRRATNCATSSPTRTSRCRCWRCKRRRAEGSRRQPQPAPSTPRARGSCSSSSSASAATSSMRSCAATSTTSRSRAISDRSSSSTTPRPTCSRSIPGKVTPGRVRRVAVRAGHPGDRAADARRARFDVVDAARIAWLGSRHAAAAVADRRRGARRNGCTSSRACRRR